MQIIFLVFSDILRTRVTTSNAKRVDDARNNKASSKYNQQFKKGMHRFKSRIKNNVFICRNARFVNVKQEYKTLSCMAS